MQLLANLKLYTWLWSFLLQQHRSRQKAKSQAVGGASKTEWMVSLRLGWFRSVGDRMTWRVDMT